MRCIHLIEPYQLIYFIYYFGLNVRAIQPLIIILIVIIITPNTTIWILFPCACTMVMFLTLGYHCETLSFSQSFENRSSIFAVAIKLLFYFSQTARWSALLLGVFYGKQRFGKLTSLRSSVHKSVVQHIFSHWSF